MIITIIMAIIPKSLIILIIVYMQNVALPFFKVEQLIVIKRKKKISILLLRGI